jgi:SAM-dependent methyltransferase
MCGATGWVTVFSYDQPPEGETRFSIHESQPYFRQVYECMKCHHMVSVGSLELKHLYQTVYAQSTYGEAKIWDTYQRIVSLPPDKSDNTGRVDRLNRWSISQIGIADNGKTLLDIGAGLGVFIAAMKDKGWSCVAVEPDPLLADHIGNRLGCRVFNVDFMTFEIEQRFNIVAFNKVLEHVEDPVKMLQQSHRFLAPGGAVYIELPDGEMAQTQGPGREEFFIEHLHIFSHESLSRLASRAGFKPLRLARLKEPSGKYTLAALALAEDDTFSVPEVASSSVGVDFDDASSPPNC